MAAITICQHPSTSAPRPFPSRPLTSRPTVRSHPSAAVRRRRAAITLVVLVALGILLGAGSLAGAGQAPAPSRGSSTPIETRNVAAATHVVQPGDTLWSLARRIQPEGDVRPLVARLQVAHGPGPLLPGEPLRLAV